MKASSLFGRLFGQSASAICFLILLSSVSCSSKPSGSSVIKECVLPDDQANTLTGHWPLTPVPVAFAAGQFSGFEKGEGAGGADVWNTFFGESKGFSVLEMKSDESGQSKPTSVCSKGIIGDQFFTGDVVIYKQASVWSHSPDAIAVSTVCAFGDSALKNITMGIMEVNYVNFFTTGVNPDFKTVMTHELGHVLGLNHSCSVGAEVSGPACSGAPADYQNAVMSPLIDKGGAPNFNLNDNDQGRANCLY